MLRVRRRVLGPVRARLHDQVLRAILRDADELDELVAGEIGQRIARRDAVCRERACDLRIDALQAQQRLLDVLDAFLAEDRLRQQSVARAGPRNSFTVSASNASISSISLIGT